jgi:regulator of sigma E protease
MEYGWNILWALIAISLLVTVHEFGHYWVARRLGFKVLRFSVGLGKPIWKRVGKAPDHVEYVIAAIPLGGYVRMLDQREGDVAPADVPRAFGSKAPWQRILVMLAGPGANFIFAIGVLWIMLWAQGEVQVKPVVGEVTVDSIAARAGLRSGDLIVDVNGEAVHSQMDGAIGLLEAMSDDGVAALRVQSRGGAERTVTLRVADKSERFALTEPNKMWSGLGFDFWRPADPPLFHQVTADGPAHRAGFKPGDVVVSADGQPLRTWSEFASYVSERPGQEVLLTVKRGDGEYSSRVTTRSDTENGKTVGRLGVGWSRPSKEQIEASIPDEYKTISYFGPLQALGAGVSEAWNLTVVQAKLFWRMITLKMSSKNLSSVLTIADYAGETARAGPASFLTLLVLLSLSLGLLNLLPIPILDGGQIVFQVAEWIRGRALSDRAYLVGQQVGLVAIVLLMGVALFNDVSTHVIGPLSK